MITKAGARKFAALCREHDIQLIPLFQCVGHQSWEKKTFPLLTKYPQYDLTPGAFPDNKGVYCREWDIMNPEVYAVIFDLLDEIIDGFQADAIHVGMDEIFLLGSDRSPSTKGKDPAVLFAKAVNTIHGHLVKKRHVEMVMWADRLIDGKKIKFGEWESSVNGTAPALDMIPKDIILAPWHYGARESYPSIPVFLEKGFRVISAGWYKEDATRKLIEFGQAQKNSRMLGHIFTTWGKAPEDVTQYPPLAKGLPLLKGKR
ncbi:MAG: family 20 glycosylhydrolase [Candidatus Latescibacterota bacterium]